jgi:hypothetical protein
MAGCCYEAGIAAVKGAVAEAGSCTLYPLIFIFFPSSK